MIPNVSSVYRDLVCMSNPQAFSNSNSRASYTSTANPYADKQERHNLLMEKLRNAQQQVKNMSSELNIKPSEYQPSFRESSYPQYRTPYESDNRSNTPFFSQTEQEIQPNRSWKPPNIRYRHIEDFKQNNPPIISPETYGKNNEKQALEKEFYEQIVPQEADRKGKENRMSVEPEVQQKQRIKVEKQSENSYGQTWINRESKFEDKLQSYYQLCKKRPVSSKLQINPNPATAVSRGKFQRTTGNKASGLDLQKAVKMLSLD